MCGFIMIAQYLHNYFQIWNLRVQKNIENIAFKVVQMKFLAMYITNQKLSFYIFTVGNLENITWNMIFTWYPNHFWHKIKIYNFDHTM